jgi:membrane protein YdbS with pleckstrin-like domain
LQPRPTGTWHRMTDSAWILVTIFGTCLLIFVLTVLLTPPLQRLRRRQGIETGPEPPLRKQYRGVAIVCVGSAIATALLVFADGNAWVYVLAAVVFVAMMIVVVKTSLRDAREARQSHRHDDAGGLRA